MQSGLKTIKMVLPYFWPKGELELRVRVVIAVLLIIASRIVCHNLPMAGTDKFY